MKEQSYREEEVADVAHPKHVTELIDFPIMNSLSQEKDERQNSDESKRAVGWVIQIQYLRPRGLAL